MQERIAKCLVLTDDGRETPENLTSLLARQGLGPIRSVKAGECLDLLGVQDWRFLAIDANNDGRMALRVLSQSRQTWPDVPVLMFVRQGDIHTAVQAMKAGAFDCIEMPIDAALLRAAIKALDGYGNREADDPLLALTRVERIVLCHVLDGRTNRGIADAMSRSPRTVEVHRQHIMHKLNASNLIDLVKRVMKADTKTPRPPDAGATSQGCARPLSGGHF